MKALEKHVVELECKKCVFEVGKYFHTDSYVEYGRYVYKKRVLFGGKNNTTLLWRLGEKEVKNWLRK